MQDVCALVTPAHGNDVSCAWGSGLAGPRAYGNEKKSMKGRGEIRHLLLVATHLLLVASLLLVVRPGAPSSVLVTTSKALVTTSFLLLLVRHLLLLAMHLFVVHVLCMDPFGGLFDDMKCFRALARKTNRWMNFDCCKDAAYKSWQVSIPARYMLSSGVANSRCIADWTAFAQR